jgi:NADPH-dependent 2,4-dienoyl-CoA reductase/sulfur reductase-like enzyme
MTSPDYAVAIIGAGPSGIAAALALTERGVGRVIVLEREAEAGGIPRHCGHKTFGLSEFGWLMSGPSYARRLVAKANASGIEISTRTSVLALKEGGELTLTDPDAGIRAIRARRVLIATGVRETPRSARLVGGARPVGVLTTGALQNFIYVKKSKPFRRPVVIGTELVSFSALLTCRHAGIMPLAMIEENDRPTAYRLFAAYPRLWGIALRYGTSLVEIHGRDRVDGVLVESASRKRETIACDGVLFTGKFVPAAELVRQGPFALDPATEGPSIDHFGRLSDPAYYAAGNVLRPVETSGWCYSEGRDIGHVIADDLAGKLPQSDKAITIEHGPGLKYIMPQRLASGANDHAHQALQLRVKRAVRGRLIVEADGRVIFTRSISLQPERRFLLPLSVIDRSASRLRISIEE